MIGSLGNLLRLRSLSVILNNCISAEDVLFFFVLFLELLEVVALSLKLSPELVFDCFNCTRVDLTLLLNILLNRMQSLFCFLRRLVKLFYPLFFLLLSGCHLLFLIYEDIYSVLLFIGLCLFNVLFDRSVVLLVALVAFLTEFVVVVLDVLAALGALLFQRLEVVLSIETLVLKVLQMALGVRFVAALVEDQLGCLFHCDVDGFLSRSLHFLNTILLALEHLLGLDNLTALVFQQEGANIVV